MTKLYSWLIALACWLIAIVMLVTKLLIDFLTHWTMPHKLLTLLVFSYLAYIVLQPTVEEISNTIWKIRYYGVKERYPDLMSKIDQDIEEILQERRSK